MWLCFSFRFNTAVKQEAAYLRLVHPTSDDIPSCFRLMELLNGRSWYGVIFEPSGDLC